MPPVLRLPAPEQPRIMRMSAPECPNSTRRPAPGVPGPSAYDVWLSQGNHGAVQDFLDSLKAPATGFGSIDYTDLDKDTPLPLPEGVWTRVARNLAPSPSNGNLPSGPWAGFAFWRDGKLWARASGDGYLIKFAYRVTPEQRGASIKFGVWPNGEQAFDFAPGPIMIAADAGHEETSSATFYTQARSRFASFGAEIYLLSSSGATLLEFSPEIAPVSYAP